MARAASPELIERLEREARRNPAGYRVRLTLLAIAGDLALTAVQIAPIFAISFFAVVIGNRMFFYWVGAAAVLFFAWVLRPAFRVEGRELERTEAPGLFRELDALHEKLRVPGRMEVRLDDDLNASAAESLGLLGLVGTRRVLTLGVPLLATLNREELIAVIAHEFGHFSRRHGRLGHWLYRARIGWLKYAAYVSESESPFERAAVWYAGRFVPYFSVRSFVHSRQCEYEADADGALAVGAAVFSAALTRIAVTGKFREEVFPRQVKAWLEESPVPPADFHQRFARAARNAATSALPPLLEGALSEQSGWADTHPPTSERLAALQQKPHLAPAGASAGESLLGEAWPAILAEFNAKWTREDAVGWALEHFIGKHVTRELIEADAQAAQAWPLERRLARARALRKVQPEKGLEELRSLHQANPSSPPVGFAYASASLREDDAAGVSLMATVLKSNPRYRLAGHQRLLAYYERRGETQQIDRCRALVKLAIQRERRAVAEFLDAMDSGKAAASALAPNAKQALRDSLALDRAVPKAWLLEGSAELQIAAAGTKVPAVVHALVLMLDPQVLRACGDDESSVHRRYASALATLIAADQIPVVRTFFTTENVPAGFTTFSPALIHPA